MKRENRDINVAGEANILKFSKIDNTGTALRHFELFCDDALANMIVDWYDWLAPPFGTFLPPYNFKIYLALFTPPSPVNIKTTTKYHA